MICLKTIVLQGFKSFAHLTIIEFSSGLNVVVGPNGSGKSNLLDALRFVLGERTRDGKGSQISRVIFHGSASYRSLGMASVETKWTTKGGNGAWSMERRVFASGESEYFWNGEKVRLLDLRSKVRATGFSLERMGMGVVSNDYLVALFDFRPSERLRWLEQVSGVAELWVKLHALLSRLERAREREKRLVERLKEIESQMERLKILAQEEEEYLRMEEESRSAKKVYLCKLKVLKEEKMRALSEERGRLEREVAEIALQIEAQKEEFSLERQNLDLLRASLRQWQEERESKEALKRKSEEELYHLLTRYRESLKLGLFYKEKLKTLENEVFQLESRIQLWLQKNKNWVRCLDGDRAQEKLLHLRKEKMEKLSALQKKHMALEKKLSQQEAYLARVVEEARWGDKRKRKVEEEMQKLSSGIVQKEESLRYLEEKRRKLEQDIRVAQEILAKKKVLLQKIAKKMAQIREGTLSPEAQKLLCRLGEMGWSQRSLYALSWFLQDKECYDKPTVNLREFAERNLGKLMVLCADSLWSSCSLQEIQSRLQMDSPLSVHLVSSDGSCIVLQGGILAFPLKTVSASRGFNFLQSLRRRKANLEKDIQRVEQGIATLEREFRAVEKKHWEIGFELEHAYKRREQLRREHQDVALEIEDRKRAEDEIRKEMESVSAALVVLQEEKEGIERSLKNLERSLQRIQEVLLARKNLEGEREKLRWEAQVLKNKWQEIRSFFEGEREARLALEHRLGMLIPTLQECQGFLAEKITLLERGKSMEKAQILALQRRENAVQELEERKRELLQKLERIRLQEEKLSLEHEVLERELGELNDVETTGNFESWDIRNIEDFLEKRMAWLKSQKVRRGSIEEFRELQRRYDDLRQKDHEIRHFLGQAETECSRLEREGKKKFKEFLREVRNFFAHYFEKVFRGGEVYFLEGSEGVDIEVRIPGKKRQPLSFLSSGERALTALCLLFAVFEAGKFPFCFLDEVDANLDHTNSALFAEVLSDFSRSRQVIVVTHQEEVMERAHRIIGVTMNEPGISQVVCFEPSTSKGSIEEVQHDFLIS